MTAYYLPRPPRVVYDRAKAQQDGSKNDAPMSIPQERLAEFQIAGVAEPGATAIPFDASAGDLTLTCLPGYGWGAIVPGDYEGRPETSDVNLAPDHPVTVCVPVAFANGGKVRIWSSGGMQCFVDVKRIERPFDPGLGGVWGVAGNWSTAQAAHVGVRRFQNWGRALSPDQVHGILGGDLIFYPTFLAEARDWSVDEARTETRAVVDQIGGGHSYIIGSEPERAGIAAWEFAGRFKRIVEGIMLADPSAKIVGPSIMWYGQDPDAKAYFWRFIDQGTGRLMHKIGIHSYTNGNVKDGEGRVQYWLCNPTAMLNELRAFRRDCDGHPDLAGKAIVDSEASLIHPEGTAGYPPEHPLVVEQARRFFDEFLPMLKAELTSLHVEALLVFQSSQAKWNDQMYVYNPVGMVDARGQWTEYANTLSALARS